jgi:hypothetical protein
MTDWVPRFFSLVSSSASQHFCVGTEVSHAKARRPEIKSDTTICGSAAATSLANSGGTPGSDGRIGHRKGTQLTACAAIGGPNREIIYFPLTGLICVGPRQEW